MGVNILKAIVYAPSLFIFLVLLSYPNYLVSPGVDTDYHLTRAREIIENPLKGLYWDYLRCYPQGKAVNHQPLFHIATAFLWVLGGVRFAYAFLTVFQIVFTSWAASFFAKRYGVIAGVAAGFFVLFCPRTDILEVPLPSAYLLPMILLAIHFLIEKNTKYAFVFSLLALLTHPGALFVFPLIFLLDDYKKRENIRSVLGLLPVWLFHVIYWLYFRGQMGQEVGINYQKFILVFIKFLLFYSQEYAIFYGLAILGAIIIRKKKETKLLLFAFVSLTLFSMLFAEDPRFIQYAIMPTGIFIGVALNAFYEKIKNKENKSIYIAGAAMLLLYIISSTPNVPMLFYQLDRGWDQLERYEFEGPYEGMKYAIEELTEPDEVIYADNALADKVAWMTGRKVSNCGKFGEPAGYSSSPRRINVKKYPLGDGTFEILILVDFCKRGTPIILPSECDELCRPVCIE